MAKGKIAQVIGTVVDIEFPPEELPALFNAVEIPQAGGKISADEIACFRRAPDHEPVHPLPAGEGDHFRPGGRRHTTRQAGAEKQQNRQDDSQELPPCFRSPFHLIGRL